MTTHFPLVITVKMDTISVHTFDGLEVVHWVEDEWLEDPSITPAIANAIHLAHAKPHTLLRLNLDHITSQLISIKADTISYPYVGR